MLSFFRSVFLSLAGLLACSLWGSSFRPFVASRSERSGPVPKHPPPCLVQAGCSKERKGFGILRRLLSSTQSAKCGSVRLSLNLPEIPASSPSPLSTILNALDNRFPQLSPLFGGIPVFSTYTEHTTVQDDSIGRHTTRPSPFGCRFAHSRVPP